MPLYLYLQLLFFISELILLILKRSKKGDVKNNRDRGSLLILWIIIVGCLCIGPYSAAYGVWAFTNVVTGTYTGIIICFIGFIIRWTAIIQLGKMFTVDVAIADEHVLKTTGLYKIVRHPSYLGLMLIIAGLAICMNSLLTFFIMVIPTFLAVNYRINVEEKALEGQFGSQYKSYKAKVSKIIPGLY